MTSVKATIPPDSLTSNTGQSSAPICMLPRFPAKVRVTSMGAAEPGLACCAVQLPSRRCGPVAVLAGDALFAGGGDSCWANDAGGDGCAGGGSKGAAVGK